MPAWPGGECPDCGLDVPANVVRCPECRRLLNESLELDSVEIPAFIPLRELSAMYEVEAKGHYLVCPSCNHELRIARKYAGIEVQCKFCDAPFVFSLTDPNAKLVAHYFDCPHCNKELRAATKYVGTEVACKHCGGHIRPVERVAHS